MVERRCEATRQTAPPRIDSSDLLPDELGFVPHVTCYLLYVLGKSTVCRKPAARQTRKLTLEPLGYLRNNSDPLPNYGRRYRAGRRISTAAVESAVNQLVDKRMSKSQQMRWDPRGVERICCFFTSRLAIT